MIWRYELPLESQSFGPDSRWETGVDYTVIRQDALEDLLDAGERLAALVEGMSDHPSTQHHHRNAMVRALRLWKRRRRGFDGQEKAARTRQGARPGEG